MGAIKKMRDQMHGAYEAAVKQYEEDCRAGRFVYEQPSYTLSKVEYLFLGNYDYQVCLNSVNGNIATYNVNVEEITKYLATREADEADVSQP